MNKQEFNTALNNAMHHKDNDRYYYLAELVLIADNESRLAILLNKQVTYLVDKCEKNKTKVNPAWLPIKAALDFVIKFKNNIDKQLVKKYNQESR